MVKTPSAPPARDPRAPIRVDLSACEDNHVVLVDPASTQGHDVLDVVWLTDGEVKVQATLELDDGEQMVARLHMATMVDVHFQPSPYDAEPPAPSPSVVMWKDVKGTDPELYRKALRNGPPPEDVRRQLQAGTLSWDEVGFPGDEAPPRADDPSAVAGERGPAFGGAAPDDGGEGGPEED